MIEVKNLVKKYGDHLAVDNISFTVEKGQIYGFLGPNGAGKSTTMNIITGCLSATSGTVLINGHDILTDAIKAKSSIGYLPEQPPLYTDMTAEEYLSFVGSLKGIKKKQLKDAVAAVIEKTGIFDVKNRLIKNLSKGYKQRVGLAQAILGDPEVIILDEPTVGLDPAQIIEIRNVIKSLAGEHTVIFSSHILSEVSEICNRILIISGGKIIAENSPENLEAGIVSNDVIYVSVNGTVENVEKALGNIGEVVSFKIEKTHQDGKVDIVIECAKDSDVAADISKALFENECYIIKLEEKKASLEDVFMELIGSEQTEYVGESDECETDEENEVSEGFEAVEENEEEEAD